MDHRHARAPIALAALLVTLAVGCQSTKGSVSSGRYESPLKDFSLPIPVPGPGLKIEDGVATDATGQLHGAWVSFHNDFGNLVALESAEMPENERQVLHEPAGVSEHLKRFLDEAYLPSKRRGFPALRTSHEETTSLPAGSTALFVVIDLPGGSTLVEINPQHPQGQRMDSTRPHLFFVHGSVQYVLSVEHNTVFTAGKSVRGESADAAQIAQWKEELVKIYGSFSFR